MITTTLRSATLATLAQTLNDQRTRSLDVVVPAAKLTTRDGCPVITGAEPKIDDNGVTPVDGIYQPTGIAFDHLATRVDMPTRFARRLRDDVRPDMHGLLDHNLNTLLANTSGSFMLRLLKSDDAIADGFDGVVRAVLSDRYRCIDNFDVLLAALRGIQNAGINDVKIEGDITDRRMVVRVHSEAVAVHARSVVENYRSPFTGETGRELPMLYAGFVLTNSELGFGQFRITPRGVFQVCTNGMTITKEGFGRVHLGAKLDEGVVEWSDATVAANLALVTSQATDAVARFLTADYWAAKIDQIEKDAGIEVADAPATIAAVSKSLGFTEDVANQILNAFIDGGQRTAGGVMQAMTATAQRVDDGDLALDLDNAALEGLRLAAHPRVLARASQ